MREAVPELVDARDPKKGRNNMADVRLWFSAGPWYLLHMDQCEHLALYGFMLYGGRDNFSRCCVACAQTEQPHVIAVRTDNLPIVVLRNKSNASIMLWAFNAFEHLHGLLPYKAMFDRGTESIQLKNFLSKHGPKGEEGVTEGPSTCNNVIEHMWGQLHTWLIPKTGSSPSQ